MEHNKPGLHDQVTNILFTNNKLAPQDAIDLVACEYCGATSVFLGTTRDVKNGRHIVELEYECYEQMAKKEVVKICQKIRERKKEVRHLVVWHRLGSVPVKEVSVIIAASSPHRADAMEAVQECMDTLKALVPIWKKEIYSDGSSEWMENKECSWNERNSEKLSAS